MAFQFPDPIVTPEFTGDNGITYVWDDSDGKWVIGSIASEDIIGDCANSEDTVCDQLEQIKLGLVEIEEELESLAPALERGVWLYEQQTGNNAVLRPPNSARYFLLKGYTIGDPLLMGVDFTEDYADADAVVFSNTEWNLDDENGVGGSTHNWSTVEVGEIIDLFDKPDNDGLFGKITEVNDQIYGNDSILIAFDRIEFLGSPTNNEPYLTRLKIFKEPEGGDAGEFVKKTGDKMSGTLTMGDTSQMPDGSNTDSPTVTFKAKNSSGTIRTNTLEVKSDANTLYSSGAFRAGGNISANGVIQYNGSSRIKLGNSNAIHELTIGNNAALQWDNSYGIRGIRAANQWGANGKFLAYSSTYGVEWKTALTSQTQSDWNQTNSSHAAYIKNKPNINYVITKDSNGNYYVQ